MYKTKLHIKETEVSDLQEVKRLWNDGEVMNYVGFPEGLETTLEKLQTKWLPGVNNDNSRRHYSIYHKDLGYCGECYYHIDNNQKGCMDIKIHKKARGQGIAFEGLLYAIKKAFDKGNAVAVYVDPSKENERALNLYRKMGFEELSHPDETLRETHYYMELSKHEYQKRYPKKSDNITLKVGIEHIDWKQLEELYYELDLVIGLGKARNIERIKQSFEQSYKIVTVWEKDKLIGCGRMISDGYCYGWIHDVGVLTSYQGRGIGSQLMKEIMNEKEPMLFGLTSALGKEQFYKNLGFKKHKTAMANYPGASIYLED